MRDPAELFSRFARQLLVDGVELSSQMRLSRAAVALDGDGSTFAAAAGEAAARYLVGAGMGTVAGPLVAGWRLGELDPQVRIKPLARDATPPLANVYLALRPYGASIDILAIDSAEGWSEGRCPVCRVSTIALDFGRQASGAEAVIVGVTAADLVLGDVLGLAPLPAVRQVRWPEIGDPEVTDRSAAAAPAPAVGQAAGALLAELAACQPAAQTIVADAEACYPNEACGLVVRLADGGLRTIPCKNLQDRYHALDSATWPRTARAAFRLNELEIARAAERDETLVSIYHSHCDAGAYFSAEDARCAAPDGDPLYPGVGYLVVSVMGGSLRAAAMFHYDPERGAWLPESGPATL